MILLENVELPFSNRDVFEYNKYMYDELYDNDRNPVIPSFLWAITGPFSGIEKRGK